MRDRVATILTAATAAFHLAFANRYDVFRDELYFIVCGRHPAFGYADQPPLVPLLAAAFYGIGAQAWVLRLPAVFAAAALVWLTIAFARLLGGGNGAAWIAGLAAAIAPILIGLTATLNTTTFEPLLWTLVAYLLTRCILLDDRRALLWAGLAAGIAMEMKYALPLWLGALALGLLCFPERRILARRELWIGVALAALIALPSVIWQSLNGWPFIQLVHNASYKDAAVAPLAFAVNQIFVLNPLLAPVWIGGLIAPFTIRELRSARFLSIAYLITAVAIVAGHGKDYYLAPAYPSLFAAGAVAGERIVRSAAARAGYLALATALSAVIAPLTLPILAPASLIAYVKTLHLSVQQQERNDQGDLLPAWMADMLGWHDFVREVGSAYASLSPAERATTAILVTNYGDAAALDVYGGEYGLPPVLSGHNQYYYWGLRGQNPQNVLDVDSDTRGLAEHCAQVKIFGMTASPYARSFENGQTIALCRGVHPSLEKLWPAQKKLI
jgi:hypothetical protein